MSVNRVVLIGNLGAEPESRAFADGSPVCNLRIATSERWKDKGTGEQKELTEWHRVVLFRRLAEVATQYLHKGSQVYVEGRLKTRKWIDAQGIERYTTEIEATELQMLGKALIGSGAAPGYHAAPSQRTSSPATLPPTNHAQFKQPVYDLDDPDRDIPF